MAYALIYKMPSVAAVALLLRVRFLLLLVCLDRNGISEEHIIDGWLMP